MKIFRGGDKSGKKLVPRKAKDDQFPGDKLRKGALTSDKQLLIGHSGIPESADGLSYEPVQRLLAVSSGDGRVKVIGRDGVEKTFLSKSPAGPGRSTQQIHFLPSRGAIARISQAGALELWSLEEHHSKEPRAPLATLQPEHDGLLCLSAMSNEPYLLLGCITGSVRVAMLLDAAGSSVDEARPVRGIKFLPYHVTPDMMGAKGYVAAIAAKSSGPAHRLLVQHSRSDVVVWDLRAGVIVGTVRTTQADAPSALAEAGSITCTCWAGGHGKVEEFVTGHSNGEILAWSLPLLDPTGTPQLLRKFRLGGSEPAASIRQLEYVGNRSGQLLVLGGQQQDAPDSLALLPVPELGGETDDADLTEPSSEDAIKVPWFGNVKSYALIPAKGSFSSNDEPGAIIVLLESGQLQVHDLKAAHQVTQPPCSLPLQSGSKVAASSLYSVPEARLPGMGVSAVTVSSLRQLGADAPTSGSITSCHKAWAWVLAGGDPPQTLDKGKGSPTKEAAENVGWGTILCSGHDDGSVKVWDLFAAQPRLLLTAPSPQVNKGVSPPALKAVTTLHLFWPHGLLITGHERGEARVYQLNHAAGVASLTTLDTSDEGSKTQELDQPQGFQLRIRLLVHSADINCISYCPGTRFAAIADEMGAVSLLDTAQAQLKWYVYTPRNQPVRSLEVGMLPVIPTKQGPSSPTIRGEAACAVVVASDTSELGVLDSNGQFVGNNWLRPKNLSQVLYMVLLDGEGNPVWMTSDRLKSSYGPGSSTGSYPASPSGLGRSAAASQSQSVESYASQARSDNSASNSDKEDEEDEEEFLAKAAEAASRNSSINSNKSVAHHQEQRKERKGPSLLGRGTSSTPASPKAAGWPQVSAFESLVSADSLSTPSDEPEAQYALVATAEYLRIYSTTQILQADRSTLQKRRFNTPALFASTFHANGAPAVAVVLGPSDAAVLQVYSLPNLDLMSEVPLSNIVPWAWTWPDVSDKVLPRLISTSHAGQLTCLGRQSELLRLALVANTTPPAQPSSLFDWEMAAAAHAAHLAVRQAALRNKQRHVAAVGVDTRGSETRQGQGRTSNTGSNFVASDHNQLTSGNRQGLKGLGNVLKLVNAGVNQALNETSKGIQNLVQPKEGSSTDGFDAVADHYKMYPSLAVMFSRGADSDVDDAADELPQPLSMRAHTQPPQSFGSRPSRSTGSREGPSLPQSSAAQLSVQTNLREDNQRGGSMIAQKGGFSSSDDYRSTRAGTSPLDRNDAANRAELFGTSSTPAAGRVRTADEIRAAYGRPPANKGSAADIAAAASNNVFEQTRQALGERGDKLSRIQDKTAAMETDAANFASMAKQLADREKNRKWWQL